MMTRKEFNALANTIRGIRAEYNTDMADVLLGITASRLARALGETNDKFDATRFIEACKPKQSQ
jgi:hypothetical protein